MECTKCEGKIQLMLKCLHRFSYSLFPVTFSSHIKHTRRVRFMCPLEFWCMYHHIWGTEQCEKIWHEDQNLGELLYKITLEVPQGHERQLRSICVRSLFNFITSVPLVMQPNSQVPREE